MTVIAHANTEGHAMTSTGLTEYTCPRCDLLVRGRDAAEIARITVMHDDGCPRTSDATARRLAPATCCERCGTFMPGGACRKCRVDDGQMYIYNTGVHPPQWVFTASYQCASCEHQHPAHYVCESPAAASAGALHDDRPGPGC